MDSANLKPGADAEGAAQPWWGPFRHRAFAALWAANLLGMIGVAMSDMASGWLMTSLNADPTAVSRVQVAANLPMFLFTLLAGALTDLFDLRRFLLAVEAVILAVTLVYAAMVALGAVTPASLLALTFVLSAVWTFAAPAWLAAAPQLVPRRDLDAATAINSAGYNVSRAVGPALGGLATAYLGIAAPFWFFCLCNVACIAVLLRWRGPRLSVARLPAERLMSALRMGFRHAANNRHMVSTLARSIGFFPFASAYWVLMPLLAREQMRGGPEVYGVLLSAIGAGAIAGALGLNWLKGKLGPDRLVAAGALATAAALTAFGFVRDPVTGATIGFFAGAFWIAVLATLYVSAQVALPDWVRGRGLAIFLTVIFGAMTFGGLVWGQVAKVFGLPAAMFAAAACVAIAVPLTSRWRIQTGAKLDFSPSGHWRLPDVDRGVADEEGPVLVVVEYQIDCVNRAAFLAAMQEQGSERKRDGAYAWMIFEDPSDGSRQWETFLMESWLEIRLFCERITKSDRLNEERLRALLVGPPTVRFMIASK
jgi:predicted MFS family arabinose efflux permease